MKAAYKQFGVCMEDRSVIRLAVRNPAEHCVSLFGLNSLPFDATASVGGFLRVSIAVWYLGLVLFRLPWTAYFDDYTVLCRDELVSNTSKTVEHLFDLLGIDFARDGSKAECFSRSFRSLGVEICLDGFKDGVVTIGHTKERCEELGKVLGEILTAGFVSTKHALSLRGRMHWFESFAFGRVANGAVRILGDIAGRQGREVRLSDSDLRALRFLKERVVIAPPLKILPSCLRAWVIFTDGACEGPEDLKTGSVGGVLINPDGAITSFFGGEVPEDLMRLLRMGSKNPIYELEVMPVYISLHMWSSHVAFSQVCWYLDNEAARSACIKAYEATLVADGLMLDFTRLELDHQIKSWFGRVPSSSNIADAPSRCEDSLMKDRGVAKQMVNWQEVGRIVRAGFSNRGGHGSLDNLPTAEKVFERVNSTFVLFSPLLFLSGTCWVLRFSC